jgi:hypothetical protein
MPSDNDGATLGVRDSFMRTTSDALDSIAATDVAGCGDEELANPRGHLAT